MAGGPDFYITEGERVSSKGKWGQRGLQEKSEFW